MTEPGDENRRLGGTVLRPAFDYVVAYAQLHEVVRAHLAGERNARYLRAKHAEIEADLRAAIEKEQADE